MWCDPTESGLVRLQLPCPPALAEACGYPGGERFVAVFWSPVGEEVCWSDGIDSGTGDWSAFLALLRHPAAAPELCRYDFGGAGREAMHWLTVDRVDLALHAGSTDAVDDFLRRLVRLPPEVALGEPDGFADALRGVRRRQPQPAAGELDLAMAERTRRLAELRRWLDARVRSEPPL